MTLSHQPLFNQGFLAQRTAKHAALAGEPVDRIRLLARLTRRNSDLS
jgi:hypothetical protein